MSSKVTKKTPPGPGSKRAVRGRGAAAKEAASRDEKSASEDAQMAEKENLAVDAPTVPSDVGTSQELKNEQDTGGSGTGDIVAKELVDDYEKAERLDLEDNDPDYEPEEYGTVDYDEKGIEQDPREADEYPEEVYVGQEDGDLIEEEVEGVQEELGPEDDNDPEEEDHHDMIDTAEEDEHQAYKERRKRKEFEIFVGGLDKDATEKDLREVFSKVGEVTEVRLMMNPQTKKNKGFAFLRFATVDQAKRACAELKNTVVNGKQCGVTPSQDSDTLFLGNICKTWTREALKEKLKHYGVENIEDVTLVEDSKNGGLNRGFAFLEFFSRSEAMDAFKRLQKRDIMFGLDKPAKVSFADSFIDPGDEIMAQVKTVFVDGLSASWDEEYVKGLLKQFGSVEKVELARNMPSAKRKDFGFVTFDTHNAAVTCAKSVNNEELGEGNKKAKVRARLSRPLQRGKGKHAPRGELRSSRGSTRGLLSSWSRPAPRDIPPRGTRGTVSRHPPVVDSGYRRPSSIRDRRPVVAPPPRSRPLAPPSRSYDRRPPVPSYPKSSLRRDYDYREEINSRSRAAVEYPPRVTSDRRAPSRDEYSLRASAYPDIPRNAMSRPTERRAYVDDRLPPPSYNERYERLPPPSYTEVRGRQYESMSSGTKRPYAAMDVPPRYPDTGVRHSRARFDYDLGGSSSHYGDAYGESLGRSNLGYGGSRSSLGGHDSHGMYGARQGMSYSGGSYGGGDVGGMYSTGLSGGYTSRGGDVGSRSYTSPFPGRGSGSSSYMGSGGSRSYY